MLKIKSRFITRSGHGAVPDLVVVDFEISRSIKKYFA